MDKKNIYILQTDKNNKIVSHSLHLDRIIKYITSKQKNVSSITYDEVMEKNWSANDFIFLIHSFSAWDDETWKNILNKIPTNISVMLTEHIEDRDFLEKTFGDKKINKLVIACDSIVKYFQKNVKIDKNKIKYIPLLGAKFSTKERKPGNNLETDYYPQIIVPGRLEKDKNYEALLTAVHRLKFKYPNVLVTFLLKLNNDESDNGIIDKINEIIEKLDIQHNINLLVNPIENYEKYLEYCDMILIPTKSREAMYYPTVIDAIKITKPIVAPDTLYVADLTKKEAGILLYECNLPTIAEIAESIADNCSIIAENKDIKNILIEQNKNIISTFNDSKVLTQYSTIMRKLKNADVITK